MSWSSAALPPPRGVPPATLESRALFRVHAAAVVEQAAPPKLDPSVVIVTDSDGGVVAFTSGKKLAILAEMRNRLRPAAPPEPTAA